MTETFNITAEELMWITNQGRCDLCDHLQAAHFATEMADTEWCCAYMTCESECPRPELEEGW